MNLKHLHRVTAQKHMSAALLLVSFAVGLTPGVQTFECYQDRRVSKFMDANKGVRSDNRICRNGSVRSITAHGSAKPQKLSDASKSASSSKLNCARYCFNHS